MASASNFAERGLDAVRLAVDARNQLGECVLWCDRTERVWWTDIQRATLWCYEPAAGRTYTWKMPERLASFALTESDDTLLLGLESMLAFYKLSTGAVEPICAVEPELGSTRINDGRCDRHGNFVFGTLNEDRRRERIGSIYRLDSALTLEKLPFAGVAIPNSICFSPDGARMYYCDSTLGVIRCCDYGPRPVDIRNDRVFVELEAGAGSPDGSTVDSGGGVWNAQWGGARVVRYTPDGKVDRMIAIPASQPSCVCFGGKNLNQLYVTTARDELPVSELERERLAGGLFCAAITGLHGIPEVRFGGIR